MLINYNIFGTERANSIKPFSLTTSNV